MNMKPILTVIFLTLFVIIAFNIQLIPTSFVVHDCVVESCNDGVISLFDFWNNYRILPSPITSFD